MAATDTLLKVRIWTKSILIALVGLYLLLFILMNYSERINLWLFFGQTIDNISAILGLICAAILGSLLTLLVRMLLRTFSQIRQSRENGRTDRLEREISEMKMKSAGLGKRG